MSVLPLPKYKKTQTVIMLAQPIGAAVASDEDANFEPFPLCLTRILASYYAEGSGWVYQLQGVAGLIQETSVTTEEEWNAKMEERMASAQGDLEDLRNIGGKPILIHQADVLKALEESPARPGDFVKLNEMAVQDDLDHDISPLYGLITGLTVFGGDVDYTIALMHQNGSFMEDAETLFQDDEFEVLDEEEMAIVRARFKPRPKLSLVASN